MMRRKEKTKQMTTSGLFLLMWIHFLSLTWANQELKSLTPYGKAQNNTWIQIEKMNSVNSFEVHLDVPFKFTGRIYDKVYLTKNGVVTFGGAHPNNTQTTSWDNIPQRFPLPTAHPLIAAYWTNPQITSNGDLWFQQTMDMKTLNIIKHKVQCLYPQNKDLVAKWAFVATWENVNSSETNLLMLTNTFQMVLVNIEDYSYLLFQYGNLTWNSWMSLNGTTKSSLQSAVAGYNGGDGISYSMLPGSTSKDILKLQYDSNVNVPGLWIFRIDLSQEVCVEKGLALMLLLVCLLSLLTGITTGLFIAWCCCRWKLKQNDYEDLDLKTPDTEKRKPSVDPESNEDLFILPKETIPIMYTSQAGVDPQCLSQENPPRKIIIIKKHN